MNSKFYFSKNLIALSVALTFFYGIAKGQSISLIGPGSPYDLPVNQTQEVRKTKVDIAEKIWLENESKWEAAMASALQIDQPAFDEFMEKNSTTFYQDRGDFFRNFSKD